MSATAENVVDTFAELTGLELLTMARDGGFAVGIGQTLGMAMDEVEKGRVVFTLPTGPEHANPMGTLHGGVAATLLDSAIACAVHSTLPPGVGVTSLDLAVRFIRTGRLDGKTVRAEGRTVHIGQTIATAEGDLRDERNRLLATATSTVYIKR